jgi:pyridinium-3,5-biscarboxylic acid mononucleotide synthase
MTDEELSLLLSQVSRSEVSVDEALLSLKSGPFRKTLLPFAEVDHHRSLRHGIGEVIYGESKTTEQIIRIAKEITGEVPVLITRLDAEKLAALTNAFPSGRVNEVARTFTLEANEAKGIDTAEPYVAILAAGTSDAFVAEEAAEVCIATETAFIKFYDVGVAGLHRLLDKYDAITGASALIVVAGMEGALPSVVGGLFGKPIFAVPTSVGYGASMNGLAALLAMLNSCAPGVAVLNIDNGFSAGFAACQVVREVKRNQNG